MLDAGWLWWLLVLALLLGLPTMSEAAQDRGLIEAVELATDGSSTMSFVLPPGAGEIRAADVVITENGVPVSTVTLRRGADDVAVASTSGDGTTTQVVAIDTSGSTRGPALEAAKAAAADFIREATSRGVEVALVTFGDEALVHGPPTIDPTDMLAVVVGLEADGDTALHDAVVASGRLVVGRPGDHRLVLFTDGRDEGSVASAETAMAAARDAALRVDAIALATAAADPIALRSLVLPTSGRVLEVTDVSGLAAAFATVASDLPTRWVASWSSTTSGADLALSLIVSTPDRQWTDDTVAINRRVGEVGTPRAIPNVAPSGFARGGALPLVLLLVGLALALAFASILVPRVDPRTREVLALVEGITAPDATSSEREGVRRAVVATQARLMAESVPRPKGHDAEVMHRIEQAGWKLRPAELLMLRVGAAVGAGVLVYGLGRNLWIAALAVAIGAAGPGVALNRAKDRRHDAFVEQLPDVLQLMAGSLKAGYGLLQSLDTVVQEAAPPVSTEFRRVVAEHRLGLPLEEALMDLAGRIDSDDLRWAVVAMNIQRRVGGNLADLLETVADTLRERARVQRHVRSLSAEGRLSAKVLTALPFLIGGYVAIVNPEYIAELFVDPRGQAMLAGAVVMMAFGTWWMRRLVEIDI